MIGMANEVVPGAHFVLVHGSGHGAWCWYKIRCLMESSGYQVTCVDLNKSNPILSFDGYNKPLIDFLSGLPENTKVALVGHSAGGLSLTDAIHRHPGKIQMAVYVAANMLKNGFSSDEDFKDGMPDLSEHGEVNILEYGMGPEQPPTGVTLKEEFQRQLLYHKSPLEDVTLASMLLRSAPLPAFQRAKFAAEGEEADSVPRVFVKTLDDRMIKIEQQEAMIRRWPPSQVFEIDTDHSPFFSTPFVLFGVIVKALVSMKH